MDSDRLILGALQEGRLETDSEAGKVYSRTLRGRNGERVELPGTELRGYRAHNLYYKGVKKLVRAHRIIWIASNGPIPDGLMIDHINRDKSDNRLSNLRLVDAKGNAENRDNPRGEDSPVAKLNEADIGAAFTLRAAGATLEEIGEAIGVKKSQVSNILNGHSWKHVERTRRSRLHALGNAVVPQVAYSIFRAIEMFEGGR